jgi:indole-3-glycerol phosphate synthase
VAVVSPEGILGRIVARTLEDVRARNSRERRREMEAKAVDRRGGRVPFEAALRRDVGEPVRFICEVKQASPSRGVLNPDLDPRAQAAVYAENGASAVSVVTEPHFFAGEDSFLARARAGAGDVPLLRKDFHLHELQVLEAAAGEADALLLLASVLSPTQLRDYLDIANATFISLIDPTTSLAVSTTSGPPRTVFSWTKEELYASTRSDFTFMKKPIARNS